MRRVIDRWQEQALAACGHKTVDDIWEGLGRIQDPAVIRRISRTSEFIREFRLRSSLFITRHPRIGSERKLRTYINKQQVSNMRVNSLKTVSELSGM